MKLVIFGASGRTGIPLVKKALERGHTVVAFVRTPDKLKEQQGDHERLSYVQGNIRDAAKVTEAVSDTDAVLSVLGPTQNTADYQVSKGMATIIEAMNTQGLRRIIISAGAGVGSEGDTPNLLNHFISFMLRVAARHVLEDMSRTVDLLRSSDLDWTIVRVPMLTNDPAKGRVRVGMVGKGTGPRISREDLAEFMLEQLTDKAHLHKSPVISN